MLTGAMLGLMEQLGLDILTLTEEINEANLPIGVREHMPEINWAAWAALSLVLPKPTHHPLQIWVAIKELTPITLQHLNGYKRTQPKLFSIVP